MQKMNSLSKIVAIQFKTQEVSKMKVRTAHDAHSSEVHRAEALLGIFLVSSFSTFLSEALLGLFCKHFFSNFLSLSLIKARNCRNPQKCGRLEALKKNLQIRKNPQNPHPYITVIDETLSFFFFLLVSIKN